MAPTLRLNFKCEPASYMNRDKKKKNITTTKRSTSSLEKHGGIHTLLQKYLDGQNTSHLVHNLMWGVVTHRDLVANSHKPKGFVPNAMVINNPALHPPEGTSYMYGLGIYVQDFSRDVGWKQDAFNYVTIKRPYFKGTQWWLVKH